MGNSAGGLSVAYDIGSEPVPYGGADCHWTMLEGRKKNDSPSNSDSVHNISSSAVDAEVTIFRFDKRVQKGRLPVGMRSWQKMRTLKHPHVLCFIDGADLDDSIMVVTERCKPLDTWLAERERQLDESSPRGKSKEDVEESKTMLVQELMWGFRCVVEALTFLHTVGQYSHGYLSPHALFVTRSGDWRVRTTFFFKPIMYLFLILLLNLLLLLLILLFLFPLPLVLKGGGARPLLQPGSAGRPPVRQDFRSSLAQAVLESRAAATVQM